MEEFNLTEVFRAMTPDEDGKPKVGPSARELGVRRDNDITPSPEGIVEPGTGGMSVSTGNMWSIPPHRRPRPMGNGSSGPPVDVVYRAQVEAICQMRLQVREDLPEIHHALVEPSVAMQYLEFVNLLECTRNDWDKVWP